MGWEHYQTGDPLEKESQVRRRLLGVRLLIDHFTVTSLMTWLLNGHEAGVDRAAFIVQIKLFLC